VQVDPPCDRPQKELGDKTRELVPGDVRGSPGSLEPGSA